MNYPQSGARASVSNRTDSLDVLALTSYLDKTLPNGVDGYLTAELLSGGRSNPTYRVDDAKHSWILRRPPFGSVLDSAHDMSREYRVMSALADTGVPVPTTVCMCRDSDVLGAPFYVMDRLDGITLRSPDDAASLSFEQRAALGNSAAQLLSDLHRVDTDAVGLRDFGRPNGYTERQLRRWSGQWESSRTPLVEDLASAVDDLFGALTRSLPQTRSVGLVHGDFKIDNLMVSRDDPGSVVGVLDWEMSTLGDCAADLAIMLSFWDQPGEEPHPITGGLTALPGFPSRTDILNIYGAQHDVDTVALEWYLVFADLKIAIILAGIHARYENGQTVGDGFDDVGAMVRPLVDRARDAARTSTIAALRY
ncbi:aminoglycoside phosphotransferase (APT) family kinase protein [Rhodococcus fascians]|uniref:phosphotransferase family protein n=1 Tax=Nocardiaceae TaxID=85025 RepID=UPI002864A6EF|nr:MULTISPECIES: phosphotransferase family protein [Rhodococcus]MDR6910741.1 aminoglycoside phosphotransferase (APT) family kinase protein [Rhodococcus sp. 3258]MDR6931892.1 aminoglycoside phosphotransferase (APT) family kinase protein [Rhodococcus fascians]